MSQRLEGKVAVITGAASGIGAATAKTYVEQGARVVLGDIQDDGESLAEALGGPGHAIFRHCNVTVEAEVEGLVEAAVSEFGQIDIMFNCAGIVGAVGPMSTMPANEWKLTIDIMVHRRLLRYEARQPAHERGGHRVHHQYVQHRRGDGWLRPHAYTAAKHAVVGMTRNLAAEVGGFGVRVNCIAPAGMATPMVAML